MTDKHQRGRRARPTGDYEVGHCRPPVATRFKPGASGNPGGRPKRRASALELLRAALDQPVTVRAGGAAMRISRREQMFRAMVDRAAKGDARAFALVMKLMREQEAKDEIPTCITVEFVKAKPWKDDDNAV